MATLPPFDNTSWTSVSSSSLAESIRRCKMGSSGAAFCSRVVLVVMNVAMLLGGLTLLGLDIWIRVDPHFETELRQSLLNESGGTVEEARGSLRVGILVAFWTLAGFGFAAAVLGLLGALGAAFRSRALLGLSLAATVVLALLELAVGIFVLVYRPKIQDAVKEYVNDAFLSGSQSDISAFTHRYNCCGTEPPSTVIPCQPGVATCPAAVWDRLDFSLMIAGIVLLVILVLQLVMLGFAIAHLIKSRQDHLDED